MVTWIENSNSYKIAGGVIFYESGSALALKESGDNN